MSQVEELERQHVVNALERHTRELSLSLEDGGDSASGVEAGIHAGLEKRILSMEVGDWAGVQVQTRGGDPEPNRPDNMFLNS